MQHLILRLILILIFLFSLSSNLSCIEIRTRYTTIIFDDDKYLTRFNKEIRLGSLSYLLRDKKSITVEDEVKNKLDVIIDRVQDILSMYPKEVSFKIVLLPSSDDVQNTFKNKYKKDVDYIAFYSPKDKTIYISIKDVNLSVLVHEIAHVIVDFYYGIPTPSKIHEVLAHYVETHFSD
jgi:hypothetical protein